MNELNELIENEELKLNQDSLQQMSNGIIKAHKRYKREMVQVQINQIEDEFKQYLELHKNELTLGQIKALYDFKEFQINNIKY